MRIKKENEKVDLRLSSQKTKIGAPAPISSQQMDGGKMETVTDFIFLDSKITATAAKKLKDACSLEEKVWQILTPY